MSSWKAKQPWIHSAGADGAFVLFPAFLATLLVLFFPGFFQESSQMKPWFWLLFIVGIDVAHVYSTLYRTYLDRETFRRYRRPLTLIPLLAWLAGVSLYLVDGMVFWRVLAYLAVYHFVRQQYGFFSIYARKEARPIWERRIDAAAIYLATLYPLAHWHTHLPRNFFWFLPGDFVALPWAWVEYVALGLYLLSLGIYLGKEIHKLSRGQTLNLPKQLILIGTALSWYIGIVWQNGDLAFTATNVVAHGIPYMALVWFYGQKQAKSSGKRRPWFRLELLPLFIGLLMVLAYFEEGLWDGLVWRDHTGLFPWTAQLPWLQDGTLLALIVPLLALPQITHYVIDGFIWRVRKPKSETEQAVFGSASQIGD